MAEKKEIGNYTEEIEILKPSNVKIRRRTAKTYFSNPFNNAQVEYWLYEWICSAQNWMEAFRNAEKGKMLPGLYADNRTAAEHYIFARSLRKEEGLRGKVTGLMYASVGGWLFPPAYQLAKSPKTTKYIVSLSDPRAMLKDDRMFPSPYEILMKRKTSPPSLNQLDWEYRGWQDGFEDNHNKWFPYDLNEKYVRTKVIDDFSKK